MAANHKPKVSSSMLLTSLRRSLMKSHASAFVFEGTKIYALEASPPVH